MTVLENWFIAVVDRKEFEFFSPRKSVMTSLLSHNVGCVNSTQHFLPLVHFKIV